MRQSEEEEEELDINFKENSKNIANDKNNIRVYSATTARLKKN